MQSPILKSFALLLVASSAAAQAIPRMERVRPNDNRARAGVFSSGVLAVRMEARIAEWHPQGEAAPGAMIPVFGEIGRQAQIPGPLIRVPGGTNVIVVVRNAIPNTILTVHGLHSRPAVGAAFNDSIQLSYGAIQTLRFRLDRPGTYYYWGTTTGASFGARTKDDAQLSGVIVVDEPGERAARDRILVIGMWADSAGSELNRHRQRQLFVINGRSWPHTDRLVYEKGETVRWRVVNASADQHPMHLHGFYYRVHRRGDGREDLPLPRSELVNTERMNPGATMSLSWVPDRLGNWLFHCHTPEHIAPRGPLGVAPPPTLTAAGAVYTHTTAASAMGGLVTAIEIKVAEDDTTARRPVDSMAVTAPSIPARRLRLMMQPNAGTTPQTPFYAVSIDTTGLVPEVARGQQAGPPLVLNKGEPVSIMVLNRIAEPTSVHWHGIELESFFDGVPGFSGIRPQLAPVIAPNDSFEVRFTPPRAGTFIYHTHVNEIRQQRAGLAGPLIVVEKGKWDPTRDFPILVSSPSDSLEEERAVLINGSLAPAMLELRRGVANRFRLINITTGRPGLALELKEDTTLMTWRPVAKDGADLPATARGARPARQALGIGETMDFEFFPTRPGEYRIEARTRMGMLLGMVPIRVH
ncbi:MAG: multicopper oxidase domain-containing protein [Gemmatimonadaceae bacterium]